MTKAKVYFSDMRTRYAYQIWRVEFTAEAG